MALRDFLAVVKNDDVARSNRFVVEIQPPNIPGLGIKPQQQINLMCQDVTFPGQNMRTATDDLRQGPTRDIAQAVTYGNTNMTFICTPGLPEKLFFEAWQGLMFNRETWQAKFYNDYIGEIKLRQLDRKDLVRYGIILYEAYPKIINQQDYTNTASDAIQTLQVEFAFHHWAMDMEVYGQEKFYGSRAGDEDRKLPTRKVLAGTENMTTAEAMAFIRGETTNTLGQTYNQAITAAGGGTGAGQVASKLLGGGAANIGVFNGFQQSFAQMANVGKGKAGKVVPAVTHPKSRSQQKTAAVNTKRLAKRSRVPPAKRGYMQAVETTPEQALEELQTLVRDATWVNPNTGKQVTAGKGRAKAGGNLTGAFAAGMKMLTGGYSGAVSSGSSGVMQQAVGLKIGGANISVKATISLGGLGGVRRGGSGIGNLIAARGLSSGIGIPRFKGIPAVRGAGFQVRAVSSKPRARGGRANHNAEGGGAEEAGVGD